MEIIHLFPGSFASNCYILRQGKQALIIDPSASASSILARIRKENLTPVGILLTHGHFDHILSVDTLRDAAKREDISLPLYIHEGDAPMLTDGEKNGFSFFFGQDRTYRPADVLLKDGDEIPLGGGKVKVVHTPGHSPGSVCYLCVEPTGNARILVTGDTLFADNIGRWDLWGGNRDTLFRSLGLLRTLDGKLTIYPGHGDSEKLSRALDNTMYF
ncbi:MAG: MBL fold metallo-hydrolase [Clostridia bacterium]|nr:MBL fold metallo-hydrolase [Clostridia bacterium]